MCSNIINENKKDEVQEVKYKYQASEIPREFENDGSLHSKNNFERSSVYLFIINFNKIKNLM